MSDTVTTMDRADPGSRSLEFRVVDIAKPMSSSTDLEQLVRRAGIEAVVRRERAKERGSLTDYIQASDVLNLTEHRFEPEKLRSLTAIQQPVPAKLYEQLRRSEKAELAEATLIRRLRDRISAGGHQESSEIRFTLERVDAPVSQVPSYMLMVALPEGRDPRDWVKGHSAGRRFDRNTGAVVLTVTSPEMRRASESLLRELSNGVGSIRYGELQRLLTFGPTVRVPPRAGDGFDAPLHADPAAALLTTALLRHPTENRIHLLPKAVLRSPSPAAA